MHLFCSLKKIAREVKEGRMYAPAASYGQKRSLSISGSSFSSLFPELQLRMEPREADTVPSHLHRQQSKYLLYNIDLDPTKSNLHRISCPYRKEERHGRGQSSIDLIPKINGGRTNGSRMEGNR